MEKKSLGRGLEDISSVFLSRSEEKKPSRGFSSVKIRDALCTSCVNFAGEPSGQPICRVFTFGHGGSYNLQHNSTDLNLASYCKYFEPRSPRGAPAAKDDSWEIEETVTIQRSIAFPHSANPQQKIRKALFEHLEKGFSITTIELSKVEETLDDKKLSMREEVRMFVKNPSSP